MRTSWLLLAGFGAVMFTFFGNYFLGGLHTYSGLYESRPAAGRAAGSPRDRLARIGLVGITVLDRAQADATAMQDQFVSTEHLFLAIAAEKRPGAGGRAAA